MKKIYLALILFLLVMVVGCGKETEQKKNPYFQATVLEVKENSILVEPFEGEQELTSVDRISVSTDVISIQEVPEMEEGTEVRVVYNGEIAESYPAQILFIPIRLYSTAKRFLYYRIYIFIISCLFLSDNHSILLNQ